MIIESNQETRDISQENVMLAGGLRASETVQNLMPMDRVRSDDGEKDQKSDQQIGQKNCQKSDSENDRENDQTSDQNSDQNIGQNSDQNSAQINAGTAQNHTKTSHSEKFSHQFIKTAVCKSTSNFREPLRFREIASLSHPRGAVQCIKSLTATRLVSGGVDRCVKLWDIHGWF